MPPAYYLKHECSSMVLLSIGPHSTLRTVSCIVNPPVGAYHHQGRPEYRVAAINLWPATKQCAHYGPAVVGLNNYQPRRVHPPGGAALGPGGAGPVVRHGGCSSG